MIEEQRIAKQIANKRGIEENRVKLATKSMFDFIRFTIEQGELKPIRIPDCGIFSCKPNRVKALRERNLLKE